MNTPTNWISRADLIQELDALIWAEERLFELHGWCLRTNQDEREMRWCARVARHHSWRAEQLRSVRPTNPHEEDDGRTTPMPDTRAGAVAPELMEYLAHSASEANRDAGEAFCTPTVLRERVLPAQISAYQRLLGRLNLEMDAGVVRILRIVMNDLEQDLNL